MDRSERLGSTHLSQPTLVLNRSWLPVHVTSVRRALCMLYRGTAMVVATDTLMTHGFEDWVTLPEPPTELAIRTPRMDIPVPEVILVRRYARMPSQHAPFTRRNLFQRDNYRCQYCGSRCCTDKLSIDHITPRSMGGSTSWENCVLACVRCNSRKGSLTAMDAGLNLLRRPRRPRWSPYLNLNRTERLLSWHQFSPRGLRMAAE